MLKVKNYGGKFLGQGTYGCVYRPNIISSKTPRSDNLISKIIEKTNIDEEFETVKRLKLDNIDPEQKYLVYPKKIENIESIDQANDNNLDDCDFINPGDTNDLNRLNRKYANIIQDYGGFDLVKYKVNNRINSVDDIIGKYYNLFKSVMLLNKNGVIHRDIKPANILFNSDKMRLIDFGLSTNKTDIKDEDHTGFTTVNYDYWPFDYSLILNKSKYEPKNENAVVSGEYYGDIINITLQHLNSSYKYSMDNGILNDDLAYDMLAQNSRLVIQLNIKKIFTYEELVTESLDKLDVFSLGIVLLSEYKHLKNKNDPSGILLEFYEFIKQLIHGNPFKRLDITTASVEYLDLLRGHDLITEDEFRNEIEDIEKLMEIELEIE